eukprot:s1559_g15.t1
MKIPTFGLDGFHCPTSCITPSTEISLLPSPLICFFVSTKILMILILLAFHGEKFEVTDFSLSEGQRAFTLSRTRDHCREADLMLHFVSPAEEWDPFNQISGIRQIKNELLRNPTAFSIDLVPRLLYGRSEHVDVLIESGVARYLEFQGLKFTRVLTSEGLISVPLTKSEIFQDAHLSKAEKRMLMRFITSIQPYVSSLAFQSAAQLGVDNATKDFITYSICLWDWSPSQADFPQLSCKVALERLGSFISSLGLYGRGTSMPLLYPMYGIAEVAQGFTRLCAVHRGIYALRSSATHLLAQEDRLCGVRTQRGELISTQCVVAACGEFLENEADQGSSQHCRRLTVLLTRPPLGEDGVSLCVVPPDALTPPLQNVVQVLQLDFSRYFLAHLSQTFVSGTSRGDASTDLDRVLDELLKRCPPETKCIFRCRYIHHPRSVKRWSDASESGRFMERCVATGQLGVVNDPPVVPQLEEMSGAMEELEHFNEQMQAPLEAPTIPALETPAEVQPWSCFHPFKFANSAMAMDPFLPLTEPLRVAPWCREGRSIQRLPRRGSAPGAASVRGTRRLALLLWLSTATLRCLARVFLWPREMAVELKGSSIVGILLGRFSTLSVTLRQTQRLAHLREVKVTGQEVDFVLNPLLMVLIPLLLPVAVLWKPLPTFYLLLVLYLLYREKSNAPVESEATGRKSRSRRDVTFEASAGTDELWKCHLWRSWLNLGLNDIMTYSIAGLVAELGDLRRATTFELANLEIVDGALVMDAVAKLPENTVFKYRLRTGLLLGEVEGSQCIIWDDPGIQVKPMLFPEFWAPIGGFAGRQLPPSLRLERLELQDGLLVVSGRVRRGCVVSEILRQERLEHLLQSFHDNIAAVCCEAACPVTGCSRRFSATLPHCCAK